MHNDASLLREMREKIGILCRDRRRRNPGAGGGTGVRQAIIRASNRTNQRSDGTNHCRFLGPSAHRLAVCGFSAPRLGHPFVELLVEEHNSACDLVTSERRELTEIVRDDHIPREPASRRCGTVT